MGTPLVFCPLLKKSSVNPYLKNLDFSKHFIADAPSKKKSQKILFYPRADHFWDTQYKFCFALIKKIFLQTLVEIIIIKFLLKVLEPPGTPEQTK